ncbi:hypothetical protein GBA52_008798 [Prunus armeniaca]|nr:hypothetical protein GBA52_008798 [Prunus armeniaca]
MASKVSLSEERARPAAAATSAMALLLARRRSHRSIRPSFHEHVLTIILRFLIPALLFFLIIKTLTLAAAPPPHSLISSNPIQLLLTCLPLLCFKRLQRWVPQSASLPIPQCFSNHPATKLTCPMKHSMMGLGSNDNKSSLLHDMMMMSNSFGDQQVSSAFGDHRQAFNGIMVDGNNFVEINNNNNNINPPKNYKSMELAQLGRSGTDNNNNDEGLTRDFLGLRAPFSSSAAAAAAASHGHGDFFSILIWPGLITMSILLLLQLTMDSRVITRTKHHGKVSRHRSELGQLPKVITRTYHPVNRLGGGAGGGFSVLRSVGKSSKDGILGTASAPIHMVATEGGQFKEQLWRTVRTIALAFLLISGIGALIEDRGISKGITISWRFRLFYELIKMHPENNDIFSFNLSASTFQDLD